MFFYGAGRERKLNDRIGTIDGMNFAALDLNLLRVFDAMMLEGSTVRAGERVGLSQPAVSSAIGRLRHITGDALFVRDGASTRRGRSRRSGSSAPTTSQAC